MYLRLALNLLCGHVLCGHVLCDGWFYLSTCCNLESLKKRDSMEQLCSSDWPVVMSARGCLACQRPTLNGGSTISRAL